MSENNKIELPVIFGKKAGMTRIFDEQGNHIPVTVVKLIKNVVSQVKTKEKDGYEAYQLAYNEKREKLVNKPIKGHLAKGSVDGFFTRFSEVSINDNDVDTNAVGQEVSFEGLKNFNFVDVTSVSKGKGFQGVMKRYNFAGGPAAHGSHFHRTPGSIGNRATPGRVFKLKKMPGHMGSRKVTIQNLKVVGVNLEKGYLLIKGGIPGPKNGLIKVSKALKKA